MLFLKESKKIFLAFVLWRMMLFVTAYLATIVIPKFGARFPYYDNLLIPTGLPSWVWGFANFDGVHYLRIAMLGYEGSELSQAFFPLYPILIKIFTIGNSWLISAFIISNALLLFSLLIFYKLLRLDFSEKTSFSACLLLLVFPTSFYLGSVYSESLFIFLIISSVYLLRKKNFLAAGLLAGMSSATRLVGLMILPLLLVEFYQYLKLKQWKAKKEEIVKIIVSLGLATLGLMFYIYYLQVNFNNPLYFLSAPSQFGTGRNEIPFIFLPQVLYRYLNILLSVPVFSLPFLNALLEVIFTILPLSLLVIFYKRMRLSYWIFTFTCLIIPTLTGTLTSMPRYALASLFTFPLLAEKADKFFTLLILLLALMEVVLVSLFTRGYWVA